MTKHEKYSALIAYYNACRYEIEGRHLLMKLVLRFYRDKLETRDANEMIGKMGDMKMLAENDIACDKWTTENALRVMFENACIDDDDDFKDEGTNCWTTRNGDCV